VFLQTRCIRENDDYFQIKNDRMKHKSASSSHCFPSFRYMYSYMYAYAYLRPPGPADRPRASLGAADRNALADSLHYSPARLFVQPQPSPAGPHDRPCIIRVYLLYQPAASWLIMHALLRAGLQPISI
jgi:hypothetical protein